MTCASDRAALEILFKRVKSDDPRLPTFIDTVMRLTGLEAEITVEIYNAFRAHTARALRINRHHLPSQSHHHHT